LVYFHLFCCEISVLLFLIVFLTCVWYAFVGSVLAFWKLFSFRKSCILDSYCVVGSITVEFPLSAYVIIALLLCSLLRIDFISLDSGCMFGVGVVLSL
jgi:hypothetical protein